MREKSCGIRVEAKGEGKIMKQDAQAIIGVIDDAVPKLSGTGWAGLNAVLSAPSRRPA